MNKTKLIATFMALLVVMLPIAFAQQININKYSGRDNVDGFIRPYDDTLTIAASAEMAGDPTPDVAKTRMRFCTTTGGGVPCINFNVCEKSVGGYKCTYTTTDLPNYGGETYEIKLFDVNDYEIDSEQITVRIDTKAPSIIAFSIEPKQSKTGDMMISYRAEDYSTRTGDISFCSGLKDIAITANNQTVKIENPGKEICGKEEKFEYKYTAATDYESVDMCIKAKDYMGLESAPRCEKFAVDNSPPRITQFKLRDPQGYEFTHMKSGQTVAADAHVTIEGENDIDRNAVKADFSRLNPGAGERSPDQAKGNDYIWRSVTITKPENCSVSVKAKDLIGNEASATLTCTLPIDDAGPSPTSLFTDAADFNGTALLAFNGTIYAELTEAGSGMDKGDAYLDLHKIGLGTGVKADKCELTSTDTWKCTWKNIRPTVDSGLQSIRLTQQTKDDLGNIADKFIDIPVIVDKTPPVITNVLATFIHQTADYGPRAVNGDSIEFIFNVTGAAEAYADLTDVGGESMVPATECTPDNCQFEVLIDASGPQNVSLDFEFLDIAKNKAKYNYKFFIYGLLNDTVTDYWKSSVTCSPRMIDRYTANLHEHPVYCQVKLTPKNKLADIVYAEPGEMTDCTGNFSYVTEMESINNQFGSKTPHLAFTLAATEYSINDLKFSCPIFITTRIGNYFTPYAEREDVNVSLEFYGLPYGELYSNNEKRIQHTMSVNAQWAKWITDVENVVDAFRKGCNIKSDFTAIISALDAVLDIFVFVIPTAQVYCALAGDTDCSYAQDLDKARTRICENKGILHQAFEGLGDMKPTEGEMTTGDIWNFLDLACKYANCQLTAEEIIGKDTFAKSDDIVKGWASVCRGSVQTLGMSLNIQDYQLGQAKAPIDVKENLILSTVCLCAPGVLYNLNKMRQIRCQYAYCLGKRVLEEGLPTSYCNDEKAYLTCNYVTGQIFDLIPFAWLHNQISNMVQEFYANPISALAAVAGCLCGGCSKITGFDYCKEEEGKATGARALAYIGCSVAKTAAKVGDAIASIKQMQGKDYWNSKASNDWCKQAEEMLK